MSGRGKGRGGRGKFPGKPSFSTPSRININKELKKID
jgi:hypothetical protein